MLLSHLRRYDKFKISNTCYSLKRKGKSTHWLIRLTITTRLAMNIAALLNFSPIFLRSYCHIWSSESFFISFHLLILHEQIVFSGDEFYCLVAKSSYTWSWMYLELRHLGNMPTECKTGRWFIMNSRSSLNTISL